MTIAHSPEAPVGATEGPRGQAEEFRVGDLPMILRAEWDRVLATALAVCSIVFIVITYRGVARTPFVAEQVSYLASGGFAALWCAAGAVTLFVSAGHHDEWRKLDRLESILTELDGSRDAASSANGRSRAPHALSATPRSVALVAATTIFAIGAGIAVVGWRAAAATSDVGDAAGGLRTSLMSGLLLAATCIGVSVVGRQRLLVRRSVMFRELLAPPPRFDGPEEMTTPIDDDGGDGPRLYSAPGLTRYHHGRCPSLLGVDPAPIDISVAGELQPCDLCDAGRAHEAF